MATSPTGVECNHDPASGSSTFAQTAFGPAFIAVGVHEQSVICVICGETQRWRQEHVQTYGVVSPKGVGPPVRWEREWNFERIG